MKYIKLLSLIFITTGTPHFLHSQTATFRFAPPLNMACIETQEASTTNKLSTGGEVNVVSFDHQLTVVERRFNKVGNEYFMSEQTKEFSADMNGQPFENPMKPILLKDIETNVFSEEGQLLRLDGAEQMSIQAKRILPPEVYSQIESQLSASVLEQIAKTRWNDSIGALVGNTVKQGDIWKNRTSSGGSGLYFEYTFPNIVETKSNIVATVMIFGSSDSKLLNQYKFESVKDLNSSEVKEFLNWNSVNSPLLKICVCSIVDANTMMVIAEDEIQQTSSPASEGVQIQEERDARSYQYKLISNKQ